MSRAAGLPLAEAPSRIQQVPIQLVHACRPPDTVACTRQQHAAAAGTSGLTGPRDAHPAVAALAAAPACLHSCAPFSLNRPPLSTTRHARPQMNLADSERMAGVLEAVGYDCAEDPADADVLVYNTCSIREKAEVKVYSALGKQVGAPRRAVRVRMGWGPWGRAAGVKACRACGRGCRCRGARLAHATTPAHTPAGYPSLNPKTQAKRKRDRMGEMRIVVAGCVAQQEGEALLRRVPEVDLVMGEGGGVQGQGEGAVGQGGRVRRGMRST